MTYIIMESLGFTAVVARLSSLRSSAVQVPEHTDNTHRQTDTDNHHTVTPTTTRSEGTRAALQVLCSSPIGSRKWADETSDRSEPRAQNVPPDWINNCPMRKENPDFPPMRTRCGDDANGGNISITRIIFNIQTENTVLSSVLSYNNKNPNSFMEKEFFFYNK